MNKNNGTVARKKGKDNDSIANLTIRLLIITIAAGLVLGLVYSITKEPIEYQTQLKATQARQTVLSEADEFEQVDLASLSFDAEKYGVIDAVYRGTAGGETVGYTIEITTRGYSAGLNLTVGVMSNGLVSGVTIGSHEETPGLGANATKPEFLDQFAGGSLFTLGGGSSEGEAEAPDDVSSATTTEAGATGMEDKEQSITALTGATITSRAVSGAANMAVEFYKEILAEGV